MHGVQHQLDCHEVAAIRCAAVPLKRDSTYSGQENVREVLGSANRTTHCRHDGANAAPALQVAPPDPELRRFGSQEVRMIVHDYLDDALQPRYFHAAGSPPEHYPGDGDDIDEANDEDEDFNDEEDEEDEEDEDEEVEDE